MDNDFAKSKACGRACELWRSRAGAHGKHAEERDYCRWKTGWAGGETPEEGLGESHTTQFQTLARTVLDSDGTGTFHLAQRPKSGDFPKKLIVLR
jgi:hypothetical protein